MNETNYRKLMNDPNAAGLVKILKQKVKSITNFKDDVINDALAHYNPVLIVADMNLDVFIADGSLAGFFGMLADYDNLEGAFV